MSDLPHPGPSSPRPTGTARQGPDDGDPTVFVADEQVLHDVDVARWQGFAEAVLADLGVTGEAELSILFVDEATISDLNIRFLGHDGPTDVLSFPIDGEHEPGGRSPDGGTAAPNRDLPAPDDLPLLLGDVVIAPSVAARNAPGHAGSYVDELALLVVHGILHLLGHDHAEPTEREAMWERERRLLAELHGPLAADPWAALAAEEAADRAVAPSGSTRSESTPSESAPSGSAPSESATSDAVPPEATPTRPPSEETP